MSEGELNARITVRNFRMVRRAGAVAPSDVKDCLTIGAHGHRPATIAEWADKIDAFLTFNERDVLTLTHRLRKEVAQKLAVERFEGFDANRRTEEALAADEADIAQPEEMEEAAMRRKTGGNNA